MKKEKKFTDNLYPECPYDHTFNAETIKTIKEARKDIGIHHAKDAKDLFRQCGITLKKRQKSLLILLLATISIMHSMENPPTVQLDTVAIIDFKQALRTSLLIPKHALDVEGNKLVAHYESKQRAIEGKTSHATIFTPDEQGKINLLYRAISQQQSYIQSLRDALSSSGDLQRWTAFRKGAAHLIMHELLSRGVKYPADYTPTKFTEYLALNKDITPEQADWVMPGLALLFHARQVERQVTQKTPALPEHK